MMKDVSLAKLGTIKGEFLYNKAQEIAFDDVFEKYIMHQKVGNRYCKEVTLIKFQCQGLRPLGYFILIFMSKLNKIVICLTSHSIKLKKKKHRFTFLS